MKLSWALTLSSLCSTALAAREAHVYMRDAEPQSLQQTPSSVTPETARLILARRLGLSDFHSLDNPSAETIRALNVYGGKHPKLFGGNRQHALRMKYLLWLDEVDDIDALSPCFGGADWLKFTITDPPSTSDNERLLQDMIQQARSLAPSDRDPYLQDSEEGIFLLPNADLMVQHLKFVDLPPPAKDNKCPFSHQSSDQSEMTVVVMPPSSPKSKRRVQPYGAYLMPSADQSRREVAEAHLSKEAPISLASTNPDLPSDLEDFPVVTAAKDKPNNTTAPLGILKTCYESQSKCMTATNGCTGHGKCVNRNGSNKAKGFDCWHCACEAQVKMHDGKGMETSKKTVYWGGPACQKKDISVPFWLLAGTTVLFAFLISSGIGLMYAMGSEELPSVIGAGVSGPSRK